MRSIVVLEKIILSAILIPNYLMLGACALTVLAILAAHFCEWVGC